MSQSPHEPVEPVEPIPPTQPVYGAPAPAWGPPVATGRPTPSEQTWGCAAHWSAFVAAFVALAFLGPLLVLLTQGAQSAYVRRQAVESLNFQLSMLIYIAISLFSILLLVGLLLAPVVGVLWLVFTLIGTVKSAGGQEYRYPLTIRMVS